LSLYLRVDIELAEASWISLAYSPSDSNYASMKFQASANLVPEKEVKLCHPVPLLI